MLLLLPLAGLAARLLFSQSAAAPPANKQIAVIVHPSNPTSALSLSELQQIFRLNRQRWRSGETVYLLMQEEGSEEKEIALQKIYRMTSDQLKRFWLTKIYRGELTAFPTTLQSNESVRRFVNRVPGGIGYIDAVAVDETVKVLRIEGTLPGMEGYPLVASSR